ncbi:hypothetical protein RHO13_12255 [Orbus wheelerorum]|uniref:DUF6694 family lipoprotein n=1 Tax=Orbus wheelerorum TaxID=3074111 RepID=UPI00370D1299
MFRKLLAVLVVSVVLVGCGDSGKTIDFSSQETMTNSMKSMLDSLNDQEKIEFQQAFVKAAASAASSSNGDQEKAMQLIKSNLGGKTAKEIIKEYGSK